ncbi:unnamed protein product [Urochloa decumbens]|uniref:Bowman-Birk serine protease inhibitors family domain-containing protein n=1 Tax=Urochloa decumbens TaxID=240449 RepID=A0ABC9A960_9POAL
MSRPQVLLITLAVLAVLATLPLGKGNGEGEGRAALAKDSYARTMWPCCDKCGYCLLMYPPKCNCMDISERGCHPACRNCVRYTADISFGQEPPIYRCADLLTNFCQRRCTPAAAAVVV